jgi:hypothetical protein
MGKRIFPPNLIVILILYKTYFVSTPCNNNPAPTEVVSGNWTGG